MRVEFDGITVTDWALLASTCDEDEAAASDSDDSGNPGDAEIADGADVVVDDDDDDGEEAATEDDAREERCEADTGLEADADVELRSELVAVDVFTAGTVKVPRLSNVTATSAVGAGI